jgi:hypothetical protein
MERSLSLTLLNKCRQKSIVQGFDPGITRYAGPPNMPSGTSIVEPNPRVVKKKFYGYAALIPARQGFLHGYPAISGRPVSGGVDTAILNPKTVAPL